MKFVKLAPYLLALSTFILLLVVLYPPRVPLSPLNHLDTTPKSPPPPQYKILGFVPYWNMKKITPLALDSITDFAYFALHLDSTGRVYQLVNRREEDPGYTNYKRLINNPIKVPLTLTIMPIDQDSLTSILSSKTAMETAIASILQVQKESGAVGINLDFEPLGNPPPSLRNSFTTFVKRLAQESENLSLALSVSVYPSVGTSQRIWDLRSLTPHLDYLVVMAYDYTLPGNDKTGPNAPIRGAGQLFENDILTNLASISKLVPPDKILLGIPFYGYEWKTSEGTKYTETSERGSVASLERIDALIRDNTLELLWDRNTLTPYALKRESGEIVSQIYFEDINSIKLKLELVKKSGLGGIAIWALGYEGDNTALWTTITNYLR